MVVDTIHRSAVAIALLRFGPFVRSLWAIVSCSVMERGGEQGVVEENKKMLKVENEVVKKPTAPGVPRRSPIQVLSRPDDA